MGAHRGRGFQPADIRGLVDVLGANAQHDVPTTVVGEESGHRLRDLRLERGGYGHQFPVFFLDAGVDEVHRRAADETRDELVDGIAVDRQGVGNLLCDAVLHDDDAATHRHRLDLVVRHVDDGRLEPLVQLADLCSGLDPQLGVEVRQGLVKKEDLGLPHDGPAHRDPLTLSARERLGPAVQQR